MCGQLSDKTKLKWVKFDQFPNFWNENIRAGNHHALYITSQLDFDSGCYNLIIYVS